MPCRGVRGATTVEANTRDEILTATRQLVALMVLIAAGLFWAIDCTKGFDSKADPGAAPAAV